MTLKSLILSILLTCNFINQTPEIKHNFSLTNTSTLSYNYIFINKTDVNIEVITKHLKTLSNITKVELINNTITGNITNMRVNYENYGGKYMNTLILLNQNLNANFTIEVKENRYKLTITNILFTDNESLFAHQSTNTSVNQSKLEDYTINRRKNKFKTNKTVDKGLDYCNQYFIDFFRYSPKKSDW